MKQRVLGAIALGFASMLVSCASTVKLAPLDKLGASEILERVQQRTLSIRSVEAEGTLTIESPDGAGTASFELQYQRPDSLWMRMSGPFGVSLGTLMLSPEKFIFYNARENVRIVGSPDARHMERVFNLSFSYDDIVNLFVGGFGTSLGNTTQSRVTTGESEYVIRSLTRTGRKELWVDGRTFIVTRFAEFDHQGRPLLTAAASRIRRVEDSEMPHFLRIIRPRERQSVTIAYRSVEINRAVKKQFSLPEGVREVQLEETSHQP